VPTLSAPPACVQPRARVLTRKPSTPSCSVASASSACSTPTSTPTGSPTTRSDAGEGPTGLENYVVGIAAVSPNAVYPKAVAPNPRRPSVGSSQGSGRSYSSSMTSDSSGMTSSIDAGGQSVLYAHQQTQPQVPMVASPLVNPTNPLGVNQYHPGAQPQQTLPYTMPTGVPNVGRPANNMSMAMRGNDEGMADPFASIQLSAPSRTHPADPSLQEQVHCGYQQQQQRHLLARHQPVVRQMSAPSGMTYVGQVAPPTRASSMQSPPYQMQQPQQQ
jgi:hypothetical protein